MWFKNLQVYRAPAMWNITAEQLEQQLASQAFAPCESLDMQRIGWIPPRDNGQLVHAVGRQFLLMLQHEKKLLPTTVINDVTAARAAELEEQQGFKPGRRQLKELKEQVTDELLPRAFSVKRNTAVWIDAENGWLVVDAASASRADEVFKILLKSLETLPVTALRTERSPISAMTEWLAADEAPAGFTVDQDTELRATGEGKATVRYVRHTLEAEDVRRHVAAGKQCTRLAMTWADRVSFVLTENMTIKRIAPLDVLQEGREAIANDDERFDADFVLMTGELNKLLNDLVEALGGEESRQQVDLIQQAAETPIDQEEDALYDQAVTIVFQQQRASISMIQRHLRIGYNRAARLLEMMERRQVVGPMNSDGGRAILKAA